MDCLAIFCVDSNGATEFRGKWARYIAVSAMSFSPRNAFLAKDLAWHGPKREKSIAMLRRFGLYPATRVCSAKTPRSWGLCALAHVIIDMRKNKF
jgi:hypothetical protein